MYGKSSSKPKLDASADGRTRPEFAAECDINNIVARYTRDGFVAHLNRGVPVFMDVSEVGDFKSAIEQVRAATDFFSKLPAKVRTKFGNDVARFIDEAGRLSRDELRELGMAELRRDDRRRRESDDVAEEATGTVSP